MTEPSATSVTILDHIDKIVVPGSVFAQPANEYWALVWLHQGMEFLYDQVHRFDEVVRQRVNPNGNVRFACGGNVPVYQGIPQGALMNAFSWYAISACQYVRTVGAIAYRQNNARPFPQDYANTVIPEIVPFRDKVAAHFAWGTVNKKDTPAERFMSVLPSLIFAQDCFQIAGYTVQLGQSGKTSDSAAIQPWGLSRVHERLRQRYWPDGGTAKGTEGEQEEHASSQEAAGPRSSEDC